MSYFFFEDFFDEDFFDDDFFEEDFFDDFFDEDFFDFVRPSSDRCLFTVRAAISFARFVERPRSFSESFTCSY